MSRHTTDGALALLVLTSAAFVLIAPLIGRAGWTHAADLCMALAAGAGVLSFGLAASYTIRATRRPAPDHAKKEVS